VDEHTPVAAARTLTITGASVTAAEYIEFVTPVGRFRVTAVSSGAADGDKTFNASGTDNTAATNIRQAINTHPQLKRWVVASGSTNSVIVTARETGTRGNSIEIVDGTGGGIGTVGALTGGKDASDRVTAAIAITHANLTAADTVTIGGVTITARASGAVANEFNIGADATADAVALAAAINASTSLAGIVTASASSGTVTLTYTCDARLATNIRLATSDATAFGLTQPSTTLTIANSFATRSYNLGEGTA
jgi:phage tail sheath gpL-like